MNNVRHMVNRKTLNILYIGAGLDIAGVLNYVNTNINMLNDNYVCKVRVYICIDTLPRSPQQTSSQIQYKQYKTNFTDDLIKVCEEHNFELREAIQLDNTYGLRVSCYKQMYYSCCGYEKPEYINPELWIFTNYKTNETIKYYISTNIEVNQDEQMVRDIRNSHILYINKHIPSEVLFQLYNRKTRKIVATAETSFQINKVTKGSILKILNYNINFFHRYILVTESDSRIFNDFNDFKTNLQLYNKNLNYI